MINNMHNRRITTKTPRECPHCKGEGKLKFYILDPVCSVCKGKGIIARDRIYETYRTNKSCKRLDLGKAYDEAPTI